MVQALVGQMLYADPVVYDWAHIQVPTLAFGGAEDMLLGWPLDSRNGCSISPEPFPTATAACCCFPASATSLTSRPLTQAIPPLVEFLEQGLASK